MKCKDCKHWLKIDGEENGYCRRYPPEAVSASYSRFPFVPGSNACGEFSARPVEAPVEVKGKVKR